MNALERDGWTAEPKADAFVIRSYHKTVNGQRCRAWYDVRLKSWIVHAVDSYGFQRGDSRYSASALNVDTLAKELTE